MLEVKDKTALVTGGAGGIGAAFARNWVARGGRVVVGDMNEEGLAALQKDLGDENCAVLPTDVTQESHTEKLAALAAEKFGGLNMVAPCAGVIADQMTVSPHRDEPDKVIKMPLEKWQRVIDINLTGVFLTVRDALEQMILTKSHGAVVLISSTGSLGTAGQINYSSTKAAMSVFPRVLTAELMRRKLSSRIRVNAVAPGYTATPMTEGMNRTALEKIESDIPVGRMNQPQEVVSLMMELFRNEALAGETYFVHGGLRLGSRG